LKLFADDQKIMSYITNPDSQCKPLDRTYCWNIAHTLLPKYVLTQIVTAKRKRMAKKLMKTAAVVRIPADIQN
jgi:hypothetical protein